MGRLRVMFKSEYHCLAALSALALLVRLPLLLTPGYDVRDYKIWARVIGEVGIGGAYSATYPSPAPWLNYPPFYLYILRATAWVYTALRPDGDWSEQFLAGLLKLSPVIAEVALGVLLFRFLRRRVVARTTLVATAAFLFNPALIWNTAYWGGIDAFHALFLGGALFAAAAGRPVRAWPLATLAVGAKLLALPGVLATVPPAVRGSTPRRLATAVAGALAAGLLLASPIIVRGEFAAMVRAMFRNLGSYAIASANAHNLWWLITWGDGWRPDTTMVAPGLDYRTTGLLMFAAVATWALAGLWTRAGDPVAVCATGGFLVYAFFMLTTEVHENWGLAMFAPLAAAATLYPHYRPLYAVLCLTALANLALHDPPLRDLLGPGVDAAFRALGLLNAGVGCVLLVWWAALLAGAERCAALSRRTAARTSPPAGVTGRSERRG